MDQTFDIPDSTDWLNSSLPNVAPLETALRCQICKDFFNNPVITSCSHTFCSLCIRRCLSAEGKCPTCRASDQEIKLRRNWAVQEIVESFQNARPNVLALARQHPTTTITEGNEDLPQPATKRRRLREPEQTIAPIQPETRRTRSQVKQLDEPQPTPILSDAVDDIKDEDHVPDDGLVPCPMCNRRMKEQAVFNHLDTCKGPTQERNPQPPTLLIRPPQPSFRTLLNRPPAKPLERLPTLNYSLFKDSVLRKKMKELGIPDWGSRTLLQRRHTEWMNLWNANCDSKVPKTKEELRRDLDVWERSQGGTAPQQYSIGPNAVMAKNFDAAAWSSNHDFDFKRLIENARKKKEKHDAQTAQATDGSTDSNRQQDASLTDNRLQDAASMSLSNVNGEIYPTTAEQPPPQAEALPEVSEIPGNHAPVLAESYAPFVLNGDVLSQVEGESNNYPAT